MIGRACLDFEIGMDRSINVNNGETPILSMSPYPVKQAGGFKLECFESDASGKSHVALARGMKAS